MIKGNESDVGNIDFELQAARGDTYSYCLFNRLLRAETHLGPDGTRLKQNAQARLKSLYKHAGRLVYENVEKLRNRYEDIRWRKRRPCTASPNKSSWTILLSAFGTRERRFFTQSQELIISLQVDVWLRWGLDQKVVFEMNKWFILKNQNWILPTCDSFPLIVSQIKAFLKI